MEKKQRNFVFIIGSKANGFWSVEDLSRADDPASHYYFSIMEGSQIDGHTFEEMALIIGWGLAFKSNWCKDNVFWKLQEI